MGELNTMYKITKVTRMVMGKHGQTGIEKIHCTNLCCKLW